MTTDRWRHDLQAPITSRPRRRAPWRKWIACGCLAILAAAAGLAWVWFYW